MSDELATVDPIKESIPWSARAAAGDALQRVTDKTPIICLWRDDNGALRYSKANMTITDAAFFLSWMNKWLIDWWSNEK